MTAAVPRWGNPQTSAEVARGSNALEAKMAFLANLDSGVHVTYEAIMETASEVKDLTLERIRLQERLDSTKRNLQEIGDETLVTQDFDGKNAEIRKAQLSMALMTSATHQALASELACVQSALALRDANLDFFCSKLSAQRAEMRRQTALLEYLASE